MHKQSWPTFLRSLSTNIHWHTNEAEKDVGIINVGRDSLNSNHKMSFIFFFFQKTACSTQWPWKSFRQSFFWIAMHTVLGWTARKSFFSRVASNDFLHIICDKTLIMSSNSPMWRQNRQKSQKNAKKCQKCLKYKLQNVRKTACTTITV